MSVLLPQRIKKIYVEHFQLWGKGRAVGKFHEEAGELMQAINKHRKHPTEETRAKLIGEIADVQVAVEKLEHIFGSDEVQEYKKGLLLKMENKVVVEKFKRAENKRKITETMNEKQLKLWKIVCDAGGTPTESQLNDIIVGVKIYCAPEE